MSEKGAEKSNIDPRIYFKMVPKSTKIKSNLVKMILDPLGGDFPAIVLQPGAILGAKIEPNSLKK